MLTSEERKQVLRACGSAQLTKGRPGGIKGRLEEAIRVPVKQEKPWGLSVQHVTTANDSIVHFKITKRKGSNPGCAGAHL